MKIGILTLPLHTNYGGVLQAYALMTVLKRMGHDVWLIDRRMNEMPKWRYPLAIGKRMILKYALGKKGTVLFIENKRAKEYPIVSKNIQPFIQKHIAPSTKPLGNTQALAATAKDGFDAYIVGSDQVWRPNYTPKIQNYFFDFLGDDFKGKRISYAASFGSENWTYSDAETQQCKSLIQKFTSISVREEEGVHMCKNHFNVDATWVLDPTMLLEVSDYTTLINSKNSTKPQNKGLLTYLLDMSEDRQKVVNRVSTYFEYKTFSINNTNVENESLPAEERIAPSIEHWLEGFRDAEFVITDSFHACVYSILFNKPFVVYGNKKRGMARFYSLLKRYGLEDRLVTSSKDVTDAILESSINWDGINILLKKYKEQSEKFLSESLGR
ncbi:polysaccharide pyruvyl transferase family protein [Dysgonomonas sp. ZJ279]|uniref:polysaccharide pyruvyl transferase family protein n=1 Tax=Dysgonomonas sp. ZJ279 TaxID=2709796 RepID=UPI0013EC97B8|nr:polysaccharide pyruvyl transferase family protein [Dysgonomonas sp. ZJ279]